MFTLMSVRFQPYFIFHYDKLILKEITVYVCYYPETIINRSRFFAKNPNDDIDKHQSM